MLLFDKPDIEGAPIAIDGAMKVVSEIGNGVQTIGRTLYPVRYEDGGYDLVAIKNSTNEATSIARARKNPEIDDVLSRSVAMPLVGISMTHDHVTMIVHVPDGTMAITLWMRKQEGANPDAVRRIET